MKRALAAPELIRMAAGQEPRDPMTPPTLETLLLARTRDGMHENPERVGT